MSQTIILDRAVRWSGALRRKIDTEGEPLIHTKRGVGYVLREPRDHESA